MKTPLYATEALEAKPKRAGFSTQTPRAKRGDPGTSHGLEKQGALRVDPASRHPFLPGDQFLGAALAERTELLRNALRQKVK